MVIELENREIWRTRSTRTVLSVVRGSALATGRADKKLHAQATASAVSPPAPSPKIVGTTQSCDN